MPRPRAPLALIAVLVIASCGTANPSTSSPPAPTTTAPADAAPAVDLPLLGNPCQFGALVFDVGPIALCEAAVALAVDRLGVLHWPITSITFQLDICPPNARCRAPTETEGWVIFRFSGGEPLMVHVHPLGGVDLGGPLVADAPQEVPLWLVQQLSGTLP